MKEIDVKIFQIDKFHFELEGKNFKDKINIINANHTKYIHANKQDISIVEPKFYFSQKGEFKYCSYVYNQPVDKGYWQVFLPDNTLGDQDFNITEFSFVFFIGYKDEIYCFLGGSGISIIKRYLNTTFGVDFYQNLAKPSEDFVLRIEKRTVADNISVSGNTYNLNQTLSASADFSDILVKIKMEVREELKKGFFKKYKLGSKKSILEVGSYFYLNKKLSFTQIRSLVKDIHEHSKDGSPESLTLFSQIRDTKETSNLQNELIEKVAQDIESFTSLAGNTLANKSVIEIVHPTKLEKFYECDEYRIRFKGARYVNDLIVTDRSTLYFECCKYIYENLIDVSNEKERRAAIFKLQINGFKNTFLVTGQTFLNHMSCEINISKSKFFKIDGKWYQLDAKFVSMLNNRCLEEYSANHLDDFELNRWNKGENEDVYNESHRDLGFYIFDKNLNENIELCDLLYEKDGKVYFVHVKNGFDASMRDLYIQVVLAAKRLSIDLANSEDSPFLSSILRKVKYPNPNVLIEDLRKKRKNVVFVMAFNSGRFETDTLSRLSASKSNIAKYCMIQTVKEVKNIFREFKVIDIKEF